MNASYLRNSRITAIACAALVAPIALGAAPAMPAAPATYSLASPALTAKDMSTAIYRDGPRETIKLARASGWHSQMWFDFTAHKQWANDSNAPGQCSVIAYTSDNAPELLDPVPGAFAMAAQIPANAPVIGKEKLGNFDTRVIDAGGGGKIWLDDAHHLVIKARVPFQVQGHTELTTMVDLTHLSFSRPDPALLTPPAHCKAINGSSNANGGHADVPIH